MKFPYLGVPKGEISKLLSVPQPFDTNQRFQVADSVSWINNLESDDMYMRMSGRFEDILVQGWYGPSWVRYNLFNNILVCDLATKECLDAVRDIWGMWRQGYPIRFGFIFVSSSKNTESVISVGVSGEQVILPTRSVSEKMAAIFYYIKDKRDMKDAIHWLVRCNHGVKSNKIISEDVFRSEFAHAPQDLSYDAVLSEYGPIAAQLSKKLTDKGFDTFPFLLFNGKLKTDVSPNSINGELNVEYQSVTALIRSGVLKSGQNHLEEMMTHYGASAFYHQGIFGTHNYHEIQQTKLNWRTSNDNLKSVSHILCVDDNAVGKQTVENAQEFLKDSSISRLTVLDHKKDEICRNFGIQDSFVVTNGKLVTFSTPLQIRDFLLLEKIESMRNAKIVLELTSYPNPSSDRIMHVSALLGKDLILNGKRSEIALSEIQTQFSAVKQTKKSDTLQVVVILNPLSSLAQKVAPLLNIFYKHFEFNVLMVLNPQLNIGEAPLKNWYRYVLQPELEFEKGEIVSPLAHFKQLPPNVVLTMNMDVQETWLVGLTYSPFDLDNIKVSEIPPTLTARYQLDSIILSGSCNNMNTGKPPRGLQLVDQISKEDTLVMANFGYFQIKTNPNAVHLSIAEGRHSEIYELVDFAITKFEDQKISKFIKVTGNSASIPMVSFDGPYLFLRVKKRRGKGKEPLLVAPNGENGIMTSLSSLFSTPQGDKNDTVHIFSVASGHMYERLLKIMILSVIKHTKAPVKFWFLKNYLSPQFKEYLPLMAQKYGFEYGLVMYKWPTWLHKQTVKMRTIWAYKVLFLDVLFPLKVGKIIFVDADQVCRTDMSDLMKTNLNGAVIGMTPFCSDKSEMDGYRFWKGGYWESHLRGRPYHISALYVVDIEKLRRDYAGDQYRMLYDSLSKDPNSLSNLDQDLPNYAQHQIPIHSLGQEWLWCESWCSDSSKGKAKTIDLCNNPQTKENKLDSARRIVPEWQGYDDEQNAFGEQLKREGKIHYQ
jgi:hypothetical protein